MRAIAIVSVCGALSGCVHAAGGVDDLAVGAACPPVKAYRAQRQQQVRAELKACGPKCAAVSDWIKDYYVLRQQVRACRKPG